MRCWADGDEGVRTWCVSLSEQHVRVSERPEKRVRGTFHPERQHYGKGTGGQGIPMSHQGTEGSHCLRPREGERALPRDLVRAKAFSWEWVANMPSAGRHSVDSRTK